LLRVHVVTLRRLNTWSRVGVQPAELLNVAEYCGVHQALLGKMQGIHGPMCFTNNHVVRTVNKDGHRTEVIRQWRWQRPNAWSRYCLWWCSM